MLVEELLSRLRSEFGALTRGLDPANAREVEKLLQALECQGQVALPQLTKLLGDNSGKRSVRAAGISANVEPALQSLRNLESEIATWTQPDYTSVRQRVAQICEPLSKDELGQLSLTVLGKRNSSQPKAKMIEALGYRPVRQLELRLMNVKA